MNETLLSSGPACTIYISFCSVTRCCTSFSHACFVAISGNPPAFSIVGILGFVTTHVAVNWFGALGGYWFTPVFVLILYLHESRYIPPCWPPFHRKSIFWFWTILRPVIYLPFDRLAKPYQILWRFMVSFSSRPFRVLCLLLRELDLTPHPRGLAAPDSTLALWLLFRELILTHSRL